MSWDSSERRKFVRVSLPLEIHLSSSPCIISAKTKNISAGGLRIIINHKFNSGSIVNLKIYAIKRKPVLCQGKVLWVFSRKKPQSKDLFCYDTGVEFSKIRKNDLDIIKKNIIRNITGK